MDRITSSLLSEFVKQNNLEALAEDRAFEQFTGFLVLSTHLSDSFDTDEISVGSGGDLGIDCIAVVVNGTLVTEPEEIEDLCETNGYLDATFVFVQSERSSSFDTSKIGQFTFGVQDILSEKPKLPQNERVKHYCNIIKAIFANGRLFKKGNPICCLYYATTGKWTNDANLVARKDAAIRDLEGLNLFRKVTFECIDAVRIQELYRESQNAVCTEITFSKRTVIPEIAGVEQAFVGLLPAPEFLKLIEKEPEEITPSIFYDNVRDWQDWNSVNSEIKQTLEDPNTKALFPLLNNGITIVAKRVSPTGDKFVVEDYQIVNGCQTSYVLHECRSALTQDVMVPVRLIATGDEAIRNQIIKGTNRQTQVTDEQLFALSDFPKKLEAYFPTFERNAKLYYERRSRQYNNVIGIEKVRVINMTILVRAFAAMFRACFQNDLSQSKMAARRTKLRKVRASFS
jgi:AIPR protein